MDLSGMYESGQGIDTLFEKKPTRSYSTLPSSSLRFISGIPNCVDRAGSEAEEPSSSIVKRRAARTGKICQNLDLNFNCT